MVRIREKAGCKDEMIRDDGRIIRKGDDGRWRGRPMMEGCD